MNKNNLDTIFYVKNYTPYENNTPYKDHLSSQFYKNNCIPVQVNSSNPAGISECEAFRNCNSSLILLTWHGKNTDQQLKQIAEAWGKLYSLILEHTPCNQETLGITQKVEDLDALLSRLPKAVPRAFSEFKLVWSLYTRQLSTFESRSVYTEGDPTGLNKKNSSLQL